MGFRFIGLRVLGFRFRAEVLGFRFRAEGLGFRFRAEGLGSGLGLRFGVQVYRTEDFGVQV